jgi:hypothetical protein
LFFLRTGEIEMSYVRTREAQTISVLGRFDAS